VSEDNQGFLCFLLLIVVIGTGLWKIESCTTEKKRFSYSECMKHGGTFERCGKELEP
jgi:hypothetical protein